MAPRWNTRVTNDIPIIALIVSVAVGLFFGHLPRSKSRPPKPNRSSPLRITRATHHEKTLRNSPSDHSRHRHRNPPPSSSSSLQPSDDTDEETIPVASQSDLPTPSSRNEALSRETAPPTPTTQPAEPTEAPELSTTLDETPDQEPEDTETEIPTRRSRWRQGASAAETPGHPRSHGRKP